MGEGETAHQHGVRERSSTVKTLKTLLSIAAIAAATVLLTVRRGGIYGAVTAIAGTTVVVLAPVRAAVKPRRRIAGTDCALCKRKILFEHEADICSVCDAGLHARCVRDHTNGAHRRESGQPFR